MMKETGDKPCGRLWDGCTETTPATLPLHHDWTGVIAFSPLFPPYKYQGTRHKNKEINR